MKYPKHYLRFSTDNGDIFIFDLIQLSYVVAHHSLEHQVETFGQSLTSLVEASQEALENLNNMVFKLKTRFSWLQIIDFVQPQILPCSPIGCKGLNMDSQWIDRPFTIHYNQQKYLF